MRSSEEISGWSRVRERVVGEVREVTGDRSYRSSWVMVRMLAFSLRWEFRESHVNTGGLCLTGAVTRPLELL